MQCNKWNKPGIHLLKTYSPLCACIYLQVYAHMLYVSPHGYAHGSQKSMLDPLELKLQAFIACLPCFVSAESQMLACMIAQHAF